MTASVLLLSAEPTRRGWLARELRRLSFGVETARNLNEAQRRAGRRQVDVVLVDGQGLDLEEAVATLAVRDDLPVVALSALGYRGAVSALGAGAVDHVDESVHPVELAARLGAACRRRHLEEDQAIVTNDFEIHFRERLATRTDGKDVHLTPTEWAIIELLAREPGRVITQDRILTEVWGIEGQVRSGYVRVFMNTIRRKLEPDPANPRYFRTVHGVGVRLELHPQPDLASS